MKKGVVALVLLLVIPLAYSISIKELIARYSFSTATSQMNITNISDFMIDKSNNSINDTLVFELATNNTSGNFIFVVNLFDKNGILTNETNKTLSAGANKLNITFDSVLLSQNQFNYSIKVYNSSYSLKYRKDNALTNIYSGYEGGFQLVDISDAKLNKTLMINLAINSSLNGTFETALFLIYNNSIISKKENKSITNSMQNISFNFYNEAIKRTHYSGKFNISSIKIGKKTIKTNFTTAFYDFKDFAAASYIFNFTDNGIDLDNNNKQDILQINASAQIINGNTYAVALALCDLFGNVIGIKNESSFLNAGKNTVMFEINGSGIHGKKLNGPFIVKYVELYEDGNLIDSINDAYTTKNYNFNDFDSPNLPDLKVSISASDGYHYGIENVTINITVSNEGNSHAFNAFAEIFDNKTFSKANKSGVIAKGSKIQYSLDFYNFSDFEITAIADLQGFVEELNESNNAERLEIKLNRKPILNFVNNITANETDRITINLSASDPNGDNLLFSVNFSKFSNKSNIFEWHTTTTDSGTYSLKAAASDGFLNDSALFKIIVLNVPEKDTDDDGINDSVDNLIGGEKSINTSTLDLGVFVDDSKNLSRILNKSMKVKFKDSNFTIAEFDFDFFMYKLNLANVTINKQDSNATGSLLVRGLKMPEGAVKALYVDKANASLNGLCVKDGEINSIGEISSSCSLSNEFQVECDGTLQGSYSCTYNSTLNKYKIEGLRHSGIVQISYTKPASSSGSSSSSSSAGSGSGGGGVICIPDWQCSEWAKCFNGFRTRKCSDANKCAFPGNKPVESEQCSYEKESAGAVKPAYAGRISRMNESVPKKSPKITALVINQLNKKPDFGIFIVFVEILVIVGSYLAVKSRLFSKIFK